jgi:hypothetical protein
LSVLDSELADALTDALVSADIPQSASIARDTPSGPPYAPEITTTNHACSGWVDEYSTIEHALSGIDVNDRKVYILANSLDITPRPNDRVSINNSTYTVIAVAKDAASAAWVLQART